MRISLNSIAVSAVGVWLVIGAAALSRGESPTPQQTITIKSESGEVIGLQGSGLRVFRSIPYAAPPIGRQRFRRALPVRPWVRPRSALSAGPACLQVLDLDDPAEDGDRIQSEDCLTLNIWAPDSRGNARPVMVFIHGGGFEEGSAANSWYDGSALARRGDVVVVTLQYRLGALGFLELSGLGGDSWLGSGNNGFTDQIQALRWIQANIGAFGGDPKNVTLFGESAGGASVRALLSMPLARDLFHKAVVESGTGHYIKKARAAEIGSEFAKLAGAASVSQLRRLSAEVLMAAQSQLFSSGYGSMPFGIVEDGVLFSRSPVQALTVDPTLSKPLLIGTNAEEMRYWTALDANGIDRQPVEPFRGRLQAIFGSQIGDPLMIYEHESESTGEAITTLIGDAVFRMPSIRLAEVNAARQPTFMYLFTYRSLTRGQTGLEYGSMHGLEVAFIFQVDSAQGYSYVGPRGTWRHLSDQMLQAWTNFARTGNPNGSMLPAWPAYDTQSRATMQFGHRSDVVLDPYGTQRHAWDAVSSDQFDAVAPIALTEIASPGDR